MSKGDNFVVFRRMRMDCASKKTTFVCLFLGAVVILSFSFHRTEIKETPRLRGNVEGDSITAVSDAPGEDLIPAWMERARKEQEVQELVAKLDRRFPRLTFARLNKTSSASKSKASLVNPKASYCLGDQLMVRLDVFDRLGWRKSHGGDFLRARVFSPKLKAGAAGHIQDFGNGKYLVRFPLFWEGEVKVSLSLFHPSEGVSALWAARKRGYDKIAFVGTFLNGTDMVSAECSLERTANAELCEYLDRRDQEAFYCLKHKKVSCEAFIRLRSYNTNVSYLTDLERSLLQRSNIGVEIPHKLRSIRVQPCKSNKAAPKSQKCPLGMGSPSPSGFFWQNRWHPVLCDIPAFDNFTRQLDTCLKGKQIYLMGDSTARQWIEYFTRKAPTFQYLDTHGFGKHRNLVALDLARNIQLQWNKHNHPLVTGNDYTTTDHSYVAREIDRLAGDANTALVLALGQHFRPFPIQLFIRRMVNIREAIRRLLLRSPQTKVVIKGENTRDFYSDVERFGDFYGFAQNLVLRDIFKGLDVAFIDAWDMTIAYGSNQIHPPDDVIWSQIRIFFHYVC
ncbi:NXPE family member 4-like [Anolis carolinensis]|uniref:NXPE family member 4-like n=1 Tax=Anolis carolinensis TaxID=28377 RepID=UPI002F2B591A